MNISDFPYITVNTLDEPLIQRIETFYHINNRENTLEHVNAVAKTNIRIAEQYGLNKEKCFLAALLHDVSSVMKPADMTVCAIDHGIVLDDSEKAYPFLLHQQISKLFSEALFGINDADMLSAIECHSTLKDKPSKYDMSLFIADKLSWDQSGQPPYFHKVNEALTTSLEAACLQYITYIIDNNLILYPHKWFSDAKRYMEIFCENEHARC